MEKKKIAIIGSGISGLAAGCFARMNGFETTIYEMHIKAGGLCTAWDRQGYTMDCCIHWLVGVKQGNRFSRIWEDLGILDRVSFVHHDNFLVFEGNDGTKFKLYTDVDKLEKHMKEISPEDEVLITDLANGIRKFKTFPLPLEKAPDIANIFDNLHILKEMLPYMPTLKKWHDISIGEFAQRFRNPIIKEALPKFIDDADIPMAIMIMNLAWLDNKDSGYPLGGSKGFSGTLAKRYLELGGEIKYGSRITKIQVDDNKAVGVALEDGSIEQADYVISTADGRSTIFDMLDGKYVNKKVRNYYSNTKLRPYQSVIQISLGINDSFKDVPYTLSGLFFQLDKPAMLAGEMHKSLGVHIYNFDKSFAPEGKTSLKIVLRRDHQYWFKLKHDTNKYLAEKIKIGQTVIELLEQRFPGIGSKVEVIDVATPPTFARYTGNSNGSEGWKVTPTSWGLGKFMKKTLPGLKNFYMAGNWVEPGGGVPPAALSGRNTIQIICKHEKKSFISHASA